MREISLQTIRERARIELSQGPQKGPAHPTGDSVSPYFSDFMYFQSLVSLKYLNISLFVNLPPQTPGQPSQFSIWIFLFLPNQRVIYLDPSPSHYKYYHKHQNTQNPWNQTHLSPCLGFLNPHVIWRRWIFSRVYLKFSLKSIHFILLPQLPIFIKMKKKRKKQTKSLSSFSFSSSVLWYSACSLKH